MRLDFLKRMTSRRNAEAPPDSGGLTRDHIAWAYRLFLDREPENERVLDEKLRSIFSTEALRIDFLTALEFRLRNPDLSFMSLAMSAAHPLVVIKEIEPGLRLFIDIADYFVGFSILRGGYEPDEIAFVRKIVRSGQTALDLGANIGLFTIVMAGLVGPSGYVHAFEPLDRPAALLERSIAENNFGDRVSLDRAILSDRAGTGQITIADRALNMGGGYLLADQSPAPEGHVVARAPQIRLDDYALRRPVHFIKMDIEGAEPLALRGARELLRADRPVILSELHPQQLERVAGYTPDDFIALMGELNYGCYRLGEPARRITSYRDPAILSVAFWPEERDPARMD